MTANLRDRDFVRYLLLIHVDDIERRTVGRSVEVRTVVGEVAETRGQGRRHGQGEAGVESTVHGVTVDDTR